ncbi:transposase [Laribacter hongkongensis]|uniref:transposase n=1 Tax=Laribacter hongkongensis TaxID=168471 RepID=UPI001EFD0AB5|nr:transposase [Laribacter hongkongensis]
MNSHKLRYRTTNWPGYNHSQQNRGNLTVWLSPDTPWLGGRAGVNGRPPAYTDAAIQTVLTLKVLFRLALWQALGRSVVC